MIHVTYYPQDSGFQVQDPSVAAADMDKLVDEFWGTAGTFNKPIYLQEVGYQTSSVSNSNEAKQAEFFCNFFQAWDTHRDRIPMASILRFNDKSTSAAQSTAVDYGLPGNTPFIEYIRTLGIRTYDGKGTEKNAYSIIKGEIDKRGW